MQAAAGLLVAFAVASQPLLHGEVNKTAHLAVDDLVARGFRADGACFVVSHAFHFIFVKIAKVGGSSVVKMLKAAVCGVHHPGPWAIHAICTNSTLLDHGQAIDPNMTDGKMQCLRYPPDAKTWMAYFVFVYVREPSSRRLSTVTYCSTSPRGSRGCDKLCASSRGCGRCTPNHCVPLHPYVVTASNESFVDFVGYTETLNSDFRTALMTVSYRHEQRTGSPIAWHPFNLETSVNPSKNQSVCMSAQRCLAAGLTGLGSASWKDDERDVDLFSRSATSVREQNPLLSLQPPGASTMPAPSSVLRFLPQLQCRELQDLAPSRTSCKLYDGQPDKCAKMRVSRKLCTYAQGGCRLSEHILCE